MAASPSARGAGGSTLSKFGGSVGQRPPGSSIMEVAVKAWWVLPIIGRLSFEEDSLFEVVQDIALRRRAKTRIFNNGGNGAHGGVR